jgi:hypothetical protein
MCDQFLNKYGFQSVDDECIEYCESNPLIIPRLIRYQEMGIWQILADVKDSPEKFFLFYLGGPNGYMAEDSYECMNKLTLNDSLDLIEIKKRLSKETWCTINNRIENKYSVMQQTERHCPSEESENN